MCGDNNKMPHGLMTTCTRVVSGNHCSNIIHTQGSVVQEVNMQRKNASNNNNN